MLTLRTYTQNLQDTFNNVQHKKFVQRETTTDNIFREIPNSIPMKTLLDTTNAIRDSPLYSQQPNIIITTPEGSYVTFSQKKEKSPSRVINSKRYRPVQGRKWKQRLDELLEFRYKYKHCLVPYNYNTNLALVNWVKRQRCQYKLLKQGRKSFLTKERVNLLDDIGFVWDSHEAAWQEKLKELLVYKKRYGHCDVPATFQLNPQLAEWVKSQRRQYRRYQEGEISKMNIERMATLEKLGFRFGFQQKYSTKVFSNSSREEDSAATSEYTMSPDAISDHVKEISEPSMTRDIFQLLLEKTSAQEKRIQYEQDPAVMDSDSFIDILSELPNEVYSIFSECNNYHTNQFVVDETTSVAL